MKSCPNCRTIHRDEYEGQCHDCGAPLGGMRGNNQGDLAFAFAAQQRKARREADTEASFRAARNMGAGARPGDAYDRAPIEDAVMDAARRMVVQVKPLPEGE